MKMKRLMPILLALSMSLTACAGAGQAEPAAGSSQAVTSSVTAAPTEEKAADSASAQADAAKTETEATDTAKTETEPTDTEKTEEAPAGSEKTEEVPADVKAKDTDSADAKDATSGAGQTGETKEAESKDTASSGNASPASDNKETAEDPNAAQEAPDYTALYGEYNKIIRANAEGIQAYDWQTVLWNEDGYEKLPAYNVALADVYGDEAPELCYMRTQGDAAAVANLVIVTKENGEMKTLYDEALDLEVAGGTNFCVIKLKDRKEPVLYQDIGDEGWSYTFSDLVLVNGVYEKQDRAAGDVYPNEDFTEWLSTYTLDGAEASEEAYRAYKKDLISRIETFLFFGDMADEDLIACKDQVGCLAVSYDDAVTILEELSENYKLEDLPSARAGEPFASVKACDFFFASGVGGWSTELTLAPDGSFAGSFHDSDMGDTGDDYPDGTMYICDFSGRFTNASKVGDYTYKMSLTDLTTGYEEGYEFIEDGIRYVASEPYGIDGGDTFLLCLPGTPMSSLSEDVVSWYTMPRGLGDDVPETLPCYAIINVETGQGFFSGDV